MKVTFMHVPPIIVGNLLGAAFTECVKVPTSMVTMSMTIEEDDGNE